MINRGLQGYSGKRVLLLQGPVGPFFARFAADLRAAGAEVFKVNFNAGDWLFYRKGAMNYRGTMADWPLWLKDRLQRLRIDTVFLFGDCRPVHKAAHAVATRMGLEIGVFEEGYVRPDYVTLERSGVNGYSRMPRQPEAYRGPPPGIPARHLVGNAYWAMVWCGFLYFAIGGMGKGFFPHYEHHRPLMVREALPWIRAAWRKHWYAWRERGIQERLTTSLSRRYFLVPLQVFNDAQLTVHADLDGVESFIQRTLSSFARHAKGDVILVFKHHPMDRGYRDYSFLIRDLASHHGIADRVIYIHDQHLPSLLEHARGVVVVNSTVGLSALHHCAPTFVCGKAMYDMPGLTYQGDLDAFWAAAPTSKPDRELYDHFKARLIQQTQVNGSFYRRLKGVGSHTGLVYSPAHSFGAAPSVPAVANAEARVQLSELQVEWLEAPVGAVIRAVESPTLHS